MYYQGNGAIISSGSYTSGGSILLFSFSYGNRTGPEVSFYFLGFGVERISVFFPKLLVLEIPLFSQKLNFFRRKVRITRVF